MQGPGSTGKEKGDNLNQPKLDSIRARELAAVIMHKISDLSIKIKSTGDKSPLKTQKTHEIIDLLRLRQEVRDIDGINVNILGDPIDTNDPYTSRIIEITDSKLYPTGNSYTTSISTDFFISEGGIANIDEVIILLGKLEYKDEPPVVHRDRLGREIRIINDDLQIALEERRIRRGFDNSEIDLKIKKLNSGKLKRVIELLKLGATFKDLGINAIEQFKENKDENEFIITIPNNKPIYLRMYPYNHKDQEKLRKTANNFWTNNS